MKEIYQKKLQPLSSTVINHSALRSLFSELNYKRINDKINYMKKRGELKQLKRGMYIYQSPYFQNSVSKEIIANNLLGPSYISYDYALSFHELIPESVYEISSVTIKREKLFETDFGRFRYNHVRPCLYPIGIEIINSSNGNFMIATKEKALCDKILSIKGLDIKNSSEMMDFLEEDLRIETDDLGEFDINIIMQCYSVTRSRKLNALSDLIRGVANVTTNAI